MTAHNKEAIRMPTTTLGSNCFIVESPLSCYVTEMLLRLEPSLRLERFTFPQDSITIPVA